MKIKEFWEKYKDIILFIVLPSISFLAYLFIYLYELGYALVFHIPYEFINVSIFSGTFVVLFLLILLFAFIFIAYIPETIKKIPNKTLRLIVDLAFLYFLFFIITYFSNDSLSFLNIMILALINLISMIIAGILAIILLWLTNIIRQFIIRKIGNANTQNSIDKKIPQNDTVLYFIIAVIFSIVLLFAPIALSYNFGQKSAETKTSFYIYTASKEEFVVLKVYNDNFFCAHFDRTKKTIDDHVYIIKFNENQKASLHNESVGPLKSTNRQSFSSFMQEHIWRPLLKTTIGK